MDELPLVSIIIPVYNGEQYLNQTLKSIQRQNYKNLEVIIVDDGSRDNSFDVANEFPDPRIIVFKQDNKGACLARNLGFKHSKGAYINFVDADDILHPDKIQSQVKLAKKIGDDFLISCQWTRFKQDINEGEFIEQEVWQDLDPVDWLVKAWMGGGMMQTSCWLTPRMLIKKAGLWEERFKINIPDDGEFFARVMLQSAGVRHCKEAKVYYRSDINGLSQNKSREAAESYLFNCYKYKELILNKENSHRTKMALARNFSNFIYLFYKHDFKLINQALREINALGLKNINLIGGSKYRSLVNILGIRKAIYFKRLMNI